MNNSGYIKIHRSLIDSCEWQSLGPAGKVVMVTLLTGCSYRPSSLVVDGLRREIQPGQWLTSLNSIQRHCGDGVSIQNIRTALKVLEQSGFISQELTEGNHRIITVINWNKYQVDDDANKETTDNQQSPNRVLTEVQQSPNNIQESKEGINNFKSIYSHVHETWNSCASTIKSRPITDRIKRAINGRLKDYTEDEIIEAIQNYDAVVSGGEYYFKHKWNLETFFTRSNGLPMFTAQATPLENFRAARKAPLVRDNTETWRDQKDVGEL